MLKTFIQQLAEARSLTADQVVQAVDQLTAENVPVELKADFLTALSDKGETAEEIAAFARVLRDRAIQPEVDADIRARGILDVVGTGGDRLGTFNISTTTAILAAAAGVAVAKHGNRAITSKTGSADVLEALGIRIDLSPELAAASLRDHGFAFFFAPAYHPAFKHIGPARKLCAQRGQRTIFNFLGPLLNPVRPTAQLMGVPRPQLCEPMARVLQSLGLQRGMVVSGHVPAGARNLPSGPAPAETWMDELSILGETTVAEFYQERGLAVSSISPENFPVTGARLTDLLGGDREANAETVRRILSGQERGPKREAVLFNSAAALWVAGRAPSMTEGWELAAELIDQGSARAKLEELGAAHH